MRAKNSCQRDLAAQLYSQVQREEKPVSCRLIPILSCNAVRAPLAIFGRCTLWTLFCLQIGCAPEKPPAPERELQAANDPSARSASDSPQASFDPKAMIAVLTYAGDRGVFRDTSKIEDIPDEAKKVVRIKLLDGAREPDGTVWIANLLEPTSDGTFALLPLPRQEFEEYALGQGRASKVELGGIENLDDEAGNGSGASPDDIILYKTAWCGACKQLQAYLDRKGVKYTAKDIEASPEAARELAVKAKKAHVPMGSVPMIDVRGQLMVGFDRARLEHMLAAK
jgi:glutaredoxin